MYCLVKQSPNGLSIILLKIITIKNLKGLIEVFSEVSALGRFSIKRFVQWKLGGDSDLVVQL